MILVWAKSIWRAPQIQWGRAWVDEESYREADQGGCVPYYREGRIGVRVLSGTR